MSLTDDRLQIEQGAPERAPSQARLRASVVERMQLVAPPGQERLNDQTHRELQELTAVLLADQADTATAERDRFLDIIDRSMELPDDLIREHLQGKTIIVTGGAGCVGSALIRELVQYEPAQVISISRSDVSAADQIPGVNYVRGDVGDEQGLMRLFATVRPDIVYHVAVQRGSGPEEGGVAGYLRSNLFGTQHIAEAAKLFSVPEVVFTSTAHAASTMETRSDVYSVIKRASEWLLALEAGSGATRFAATRPGHIVDNSQMISRFAGQADTKGIISMHGSETCIHAQSAREAAQMSIVAGAESRPNVLTVQGLHDFGGQVNVLDMAIAVTNELERPVPIYFYSATSTGEVPGLRVGQSRMFDASEHPFVQASDLSKGQTDILSFYSAAGNQVAMCIDKLRHAIARGADDQELHELIAVLGHTMDDAKRRMAAIFL